MNGGFGTREAAGSAPNAVIQLNQWASFGQTKLPATLDLKAAGARRAPEYLPSQCKHCADRRVWVNRPVFMQNPHRNSPNRGNTWESPSALNTMTLSREWQSKQPRRIVAGRWLNYVVTP